MNRDELQAHIKAVLCENPPSIAKDSGQPEYNTEELQKVATRLLALFDQQRNERLTDIHRFIDTLIDIIPPIPIEIRDMCLTLLAKIQVKIIAELKKGD